MSTSVQGLEIPPTLVSESSQVEYWYALQTRARHERMVKMRLERRGVQTFFPTVTEVHRWSDRKKKVEVPIFSCYLFVRLTPTKLDRLRVLCVEGVFSVVGNHTAVSSI